MNAIGRPGARVLAQLPDAAGWPQPPGGHFALPMQGAAWVRARASLRAPQQQPHWLAVEDAQGVAALAPLVRVGRWLRELPAMFEPSDFAWRTAQALDALAQALARQPLPLCLERVPADSATVGALRRAFAGRGLVLAREAMPTPVLELRDLDGDVERLFDARRRADFRRFERRAQRHGALRCELLAPAGEADLQAAMATALAVEARSWKAAAGTALTSDRAQGRFFDAFARTAAAQGELRVALLWFGERPAAMQIAVQARQRFWLLKIAHDHGFADCSPGQLLMRHTLRHAVQAGLQGYEFMGVMGEWTRLWTNRTRRHLRLHALPLSATTALALGRRAAGSARERLRRALR